MFGRFPSAFIGVCVKIVLLVATTGHLHYPAGREVFVTSHVSKYNYLNSSDVILYMIAPH